jgi:hypothetical protein
MTGQDEYDRLEPLFAAGENATRSGFLVYRYPNVAQKCTGLNATGAGYRPP